MLDQNLESAFQSHYSQILALARARLARERAPISTGTLAHELYLGMQHRQDLRFDSREQFLSYASRAMRSLLVDMARERLAQKRSAEMLPLTLGADVADAAGTPEQMLALNEVMERLAQVDARAFRVAEMRTMLGLELAEIAQSMSLSEPTVKRDWQRARAFLFEALDVAP